MSPEIFEEQPSVEDATEELQRTQLTKQERIAALENRKFYYGINSSNLEKDSSTRGLPLPINWY